MSFSVLSGDSAHRRPRRRVGVMLVTAGCAATFAILGAKNGAGPVVVEGPGQPRTSASAASPGTTAAPRTYPGTGGPDILDYGAAGDALEAAFPETFAGLVNLQGGRVALYVVDEPDDFATVARQVIGPGPTMTVHQAPRTLAHVRELKARIESDAAELEAAGVQFTGAAIRISDGGPRVVVIYGPDSEAALDVLEERYGADDILPIAGGELIR